MPADQGPVAGKHVVSITAFSKTGRQFPAVQPAPPGQMIDETEQYIPAKFNKRSELRVEITEGDNEANFPLTSE